MKNAILVDQAGRIVLPKAIRQRLSLVPGSRLRATVVAERIELTPEPEPETGFALSASKRKVLAATGHRSDAASATRAERTSQAQSRKKA